MSKLMIDDNEVRKALAVMREKDDSLFEVRIVDNNSKWNASGYFRSPDVMLRELHKQNLYGKNVYFVLNKLNDACYARTNHDRIIPNSSNTSDNDIEYRQWLFLDFDVAHPSGTSSTDEQCKLACEKMKNVVLFLVNEGFSRPVIAFSGNGYHAQFPVKLKNDKENLDLIKKFFNTLKTMFDDDNVKIDKQNVNAARICKLYGTLAQKGLDLPEYPHRMSKIVQIPDKLETTSKAYIQKVANMLDGENSSHENNDRTWRGNYSKFDLDEWLQKYNIGYKTEACSGGTKYILDHCPFDETHKGKDAVIFKMDTGAIAFHCFHASCADKTWRDVRLMFEPDAYSKRSNNVDYKHFQRDYYQPKPKPEPEHITEKEGNPLWLTYGDYVDRPDEPEYFVKSGLKEFDNRYRGFMKGDTTCLSGYTGSAKSTLLSQIIINTVESGNRVAVFSGELTFKNYFKWTELQCAGKAHVDPTDFEGYYKVSKPIEKAIRPWLDDKLFLYNNDYGFNFPAMLESIEKEIDDQKIDLVCLDNLMILDISDLSDKELQAQKAFAEKLHELAMRKNIHVIAVCHPRKPTGLLGMYDVAGSATLANIFSNIIFCYRVNQNFQNAYLDYFKREYDSGGTNCYCVAKSRQGGMSDMYYPLWYEPETKRLKNDAAEYIHYGWEKNLPVTEYEEFT